MSSSEPQLPKPQPEEEEDESSKPQSKKAAKKEAAKLKRRLEAAVASGVQSLSMEDPLADNYGDVPLLDLQSEVAPGTRVWTEIGKLAEPLKDQYVLVRGRAEDPRQREDRVRDFERESINRAVRPAPLKFKFERFSVLTKLCPALPINVEDAARSDVEIEKALQNGEQLVRVNQDTRLNYRVLDMRTPANQGIFRILDILPFLDPYLETYFWNVFRQFLLSEDFVEIHTPKLIAGSSEGGASVFKLDYLGKPACLAQSPQLHKQMAICGDFGRVLIGAVFRAEDSFTHRHLCEYTGLDFMDVVDRLFVAMFDSLNNNCAKELEAVGRQYPFEPLKYLRQTLRLTFEEGIQMLKDAGVEVDPLGDLNTEAERKLGQLVLEKYDTEFYILHRYPLAVRPFYTMPCYDNPTYSNSFDVFIRGEEIISGAQRVHIPDFLAERAQALGIDVQSISTYVEFFQYGAPPHGGFGVELERVVMLFCGLNNIRKTSLFPRDPLRIAP
uniref:aspartate--tRNA ligase n=1 Tax=Quercus lobata TaxID=97700 RepID=A0A7N2RES3_QUELO